MCVFIFKLDCDIAYIFVVYTDYYLQLSDEIENLERLNL